MIVEFRIHRFTDILREERAREILIPFAVNDRVGKFHELLLKQSVVSLFPNILKHNVDINLMYTK